MSTALFLDLLTRHGITPPSSHGLVRCVFHEDSTASLSIDVERGLFHCFGCGVAGGIKGFAALVGEPLQSRHYSPRTRARIAVQTRRRHMEADSRALYQQAIDAEADRRWATWGEATLAAHDAAEILALFFRRPDLAKDFPALVTATEAEYADARWQQMLAERRIAGEVFNG